MESFDKRFLKFIEEHQEAIESKICHIITEGNNCPCHEGIPCAVCLSYAVDIISNQQSD